MLSWLRNVAANLREFLDDGRHTGLAVSLPAEVSFHHDGALATVTGPRPAQWVREVADEPARGADIFPWWDQGTGAPFYLGRALARMWTEVRWRSPQSDAPRAVIQDVLKSLRRAHELDPSLDYPWREWHELNELAAITGSLPDAVARKAAAAPERPLIGYRRRDVTARLMGAWSIDVPGSFETIDNAESWQAFDETRVVYFSSLSVGGGPDGPPPAEKLLTSFPAPEGKLLQTYEHRGNRVIGKAALVEVEESGRTLWRLSATSAVPGGVGISTIDLYDASYRDWAVETWKSVDHPTE
jgi:hypothetical protein